ncbi:MAG: ATP-dependent Lon protease, partial [Lachnospiraceae bacterium]|nr:ATP-dependent Lon protease [Lachnospiraceae bacterium]
MPVFDFSSSPSEKKQAAKCTYTIFRSNESTPSAERPILILDNSKRQWKHHSNGIFSKPDQKTAFEFDEEGGTESADILQVDARFVSLLRWLGESHIRVRLSGANREDGYAVYRIREIAYGGATKLSAEDGFLQFMIERLLASDAPGNEIEEDEQEETGDDMKLTSLQSLTDFLNCAGRTLPDNIRL